MMLLNLNFFQETFNPIKCRFIESRQEQASRSVTNYTALAYIFKNPDFLSKSNDQIAKKKFFRQASHSKFLDNLWQQELYLSMNNKSLNRYNVRLNSLTLNKGKNVNKSLLSSFSKSLFYGSIQSSFNKTLHGSINNVSSINYSWVKVLKSYFCKVQYLFGATVFHQKVKEIDSTLNTYLDLTHIPLFTVSNHLGQMIIAEPPTELNVSKSSQSYFSEYNSSNMYHGFFFANYEDAQEYMLYIQKLYNLDSRNLKIFVSSFSTFYSIMSKFNSDICFKLVPDLKEVSELIKKYRYYRNISFYKNQKYNSFSFQGQPLYFVKNGENKFFSYSSQQQLSLEYNLVFTNYNDALRVYRKLSNYKLGHYSKTPQIIVYNLESFIKDQLKDKNSTRFLVVPSKTSYVFTKKYHWKDYSQLLYNDCLEVVSSVSLWTKRILWSLTSRKL